MSSLYQIGEEMAAILALAAEADGELTEEQAAALEACGLRERTKVDGYYKARRNLELTEAAIDEEIKALQELKRQTARDRERLERMAETYMTRHGLAELQGNVHTIRRVQNGGKRKLELLVATSASAFPGRFLKEPPPPPAPTIDDAALRAALTAGDPEALAVARLADPTYRLTWK